MGRGRNILLSSAVVTLGAAGILYAVLQTPLPAAITQAAVTQSPSPQPRPSPLTIETPNGMCVEPEQRRTWIIRPGDTAFGIANAIADETTPPASVLAYDLLKLNGVEAGLLQIGNSFVTHNAAGLMPRVILPEGPIVISEGQNLKLKIALEGMLCGSAKVKITGLPPYSGFDYATNTVHWTPFSFQGGIYKVTVSAGDTDLGHVGEVDIRVKVVPLEFVTDGDPKVRYRVVQGNDEFSPALTLDGKVGYALAAYNRPVADFEVAAAQKLAANPEVAFVIMHQRTGGSIISSGSDLARVVDHLRRLIESGGRPGEIEPFSFPKSEVAGEKRSAYSFPVLKEEVALTAPAGAVK